MDNLTHSLAGWALGQAGLKTRTRKGMAALILGANMPDIDVLFGWVPWIPLATHRGFTHGLVGGVLLMPPLLAGLLWLLDHWQAKPGEIYRSGPPMRFGWLLSLSYLGAATHPLLDLLTTYSVQLLSPLSNAWYHADGLFIIDVWLWLLLGGSIFWSKRRERSGGDWRKAPQTAIAAGLAYILLNLLISERAHAAVKRTRDLAPKEQRAAIFASPQPILFWRRQLAWRDGRYNRRGRYDPIGGGLDITCCRHDWNNMDHPLVRRARIADPKLAKYLRWSILPEAEVQGIDRCTAQVTVGDARYGESASTSRIKHVSLVPTGQPGC